MKRNDESSQLVTVYQAVAAYTVRGIGSFLPTETQVARIRPIVRRERIGSRTITLDLVTLDLKIGAEARERTGSLLFLFDNGDLYRGYASLHRWEQARVLKIGSFDLWRGEDAT
ncbi:unnamed protein product, partial [Heterotrigona itama]